MTLWIIAAVACALLLAGVAFMALQREEAPDERTTLPPSPDADLPWDRLSDEPEGSRLASGVPPPSGVPMAPTPSEEIALPSETEELWNDEGPTGSLPRILVRATGGTHRGRKRRHNEDAFLVLPEHDVYAVADGMGGYAAGEVASALTIETLERAFTSATHGQLDEGFPRRGAELMNTIRAANQRIRVESARDASKKGMGTTVVAVRFSPGRRRAYIAHVGDSRCYRLRDGGLQQLTEDHTLGAVGITGPSAEKLSRAVGVFEHVEVDLTVDEPLPGDTYLLCSDGLYKMVPARMIEHMLIHTPSIEDAVQALIAEANARGGRDNVSLVLVRIEAPNVNIDRSGAYRMPP